MGKSAVAQGSRVSLPQQITTYLPPWYLHRRNYHLHHQLHQHHQSIHSSEILSESLNTYSDHHSNFNQPHPNRNTTMLHQQQSATPMHNNNIAPKQVYNNTNHQPIQHVRGTNTIPNFVQHYQSAHPMEPTSNNNVNHQYNHHYNPPHYHQPPPMVAPTHQFHQQLQQLESRFREESFFLLMIQVSFVSFLFFWLLYPLDILPSMT
jgi:hypothetical protein